MPDVAAVVFSAINPSDGVVHSAHNTDRIDSPIKFPPFIVPPLNRFNDILSTVRRDVLDDVSVRFVYAVAINLPVYVPFADIVASVTPPTASITLPTVSADTVTEYSYLYPDRTVVRAVDGVNAHVPFDV